MTTQPLDTAAIQARHDAATSGTWYLQPNYGPDFVAAESAGYEHGVGTLDFGVGDQADADREFVLNAHTDMGQLLARVARLAAGLDEMTHCRDAALRALHRDDIPTDIDVEDTIANSLWGPGWDWEDERTPRLIAREVAPAIRPALAKACEQRDQALARVAELETELACYMQDPTTREELAELGRRLAAIEKLLPAHPGDDDIAPRISPRTLRAALDDDIPRATSAAHDGP
jgi:hypothetical protein